MFSVAASLQPDEPSDGQEAASLSSLLKSAPVLFWSTDAELQLTSVSGSLASELGLSLESCAGKDAQTLIPHPASALRCRELHSSALQGRGGSCDLVLAGRELEVRIEPMRSAQGAVSGVLGVAFDVTDLHVAERVLRLSEKNCRSLLEEMPYAICRCTLSGQLLQVNSAMLEMLGYSSEPDLLICDVPTQIFATRADYEEFKRRLLGRGGCSGFESRWQRADGQVLQVNLGGRAVLSRQGEALYLDLLAEDITERKELESQLLQAQKMQSIGQLAGGVAHDFNNLLMVIGGQVEVMLERTLDRDAQHRLAEVKHATERAAALTRQLLAFSRRQVLQARTVDINLIVGGMVQMLSRLISESIQLEFIPAPEPVCARVDPCQIEQVLLNLSVNARDAMPAGGKLSIELSNCFNFMPKGAREPGDYVQLSVKDTGHGVDPALQPRVFEPFFTTKKNGEGTGLGLSVVYGIVRQSGGHIVLESEVGKGTSFTIYLPRVPGAGVVSPEPPILNSPRGHETILIAEDEDGVRELVGSYLRRLGYNVLLAPDGEAALLLTLNYRGHIDLLLTDVVMPKVGGMELAAGLQKNWPSLKVVFMTGYVGDSLIGKDSVFSHSRLLSKPFSLPTLAKSLRDVLDEEALANES